MNQKTSQSINDKIDYSKAPQGLFIRSKPEIDRGFTAKEAKKDREIKN